MEPIGRRIFLAHLELSYRLGRKVTLAELGQRVATFLGRATPFTAAAVSRWESGTQIPTPHVIEAIAAVTSTDPGWISHGSKSGAPRPDGVDPTPVEHPRIVIPTVEDGVQPAPVLGGILPTAADKGPRLRRRG